MSAHNLISLAERQPQPQPEETLLDLGTAIGPEGEADADTAATQQDDPYTALRELLVSPEQERIEALEARLNDPARHARDVADVLPESFVLGDMERLSTAMDTPVRACIERSIRNDPEKYSEALFPVILPAIRQAIAESLRSTLESINRLIEHSLSWRAQVLWRWEAWRSGVPYHDVVLSKTFTYRVEQVFLIHRETGLLLQHVAQPGVEERDSEAVSGMLTAIRDFVTDSFAASPADNLETVTVGQHTVWLLQGPYAVMACVLRGTPPFDLREFFQARLDTIHARYGTLLRDFTGDSGPFAVTRDLLQECLRQECKGGRAKTSLLLPLLLLLALVLGAVGYSAYLGYRHWEYEQRVSRFLDAVEGTEGVVLYRIDRDGQRLVLHGLRDPLAADPLGQTERFGIDAADVEASWDPYEALTPKLNETRAQRELSPPPGVDLSLRGDTLHVVGVAPEQWVERLRMVATALPGVLHLDASGLRSQDELVLSEARRRLSPPGSALLRVENGVLSISGEAPLAWRSRLATLARGIPGLRQVRYDDLKAKEERQLRGIRTELRAAKVIFLRDSELAQGQGVVLDELAKKLRTLFRLAQDLGLSALVNIVGQTDAMGDPQVNIVVSKQRADTVVSELQARGIGADRLRAVGQGPAAEAPAGVPRKDLRRVLLRIDLEPGKK